MDEAEIPFRVGYAHDEAHIVGECLRVSAEICRAQGKLGGVVIGLADLPDGGRWNSDFPQTQRRLPP